MSLRVQNSDRYLLLVEQRSLMILAAVRVVARGWLGVVGTGLLLRLVSRLVIPRMLVGGLLFIG